MIIFFFTLKTYDKKHFSLFKSLHVAELVEVGRLRLTFLPFASNTLWKPDVLWQQHTETTK